MVYDYIYYILLVFVSDELLMGLQEDLGLLKHVYNPRLKALLQNTGMLQIHRVYHIRKKNFNGTTGKE